MQLILYVYMDNETSFYLLCPFDDIWSDRANQAKNQFENLFNEEYDKRTSPPLVNEGTVHTIK